MLVEGEGFFYLPSKDAVIILNICYAASGIDCVEVMDQNGMKFWCWPADLAPVPKLEIFTAVECAHDWRWYDSGWNRFEYCFKCNCERSKRDY